MKISPLLRTLLAMMVTVAQCEPITVYVSLYFNAVSKVDGVEQSFNADFYLSAFWIDPNLNATDTYDPSIHFNPVLEFANSRGEVQKQIDEPYSMQAPDEDVLGFEVPPGTWIYYDQRYVGDFTTKLNLLEFPFDFQDVVLWIESAVFDDNDVVIVGVKDLREKMLPQENGKANFEVLEWMLRGTYINETSQYYPSFSQTYSRLEVKIFLEREADYYLWKIILGSILLVIMCVCTFMLDVQEPDRMMGTLTVFLALVSFLFVATQSIPKVAYQTRLDNFFNFSFFIVFFILIGHTLNYFLKEDEEEPGVTPSDDVEMKEKTPSKPKGNLLARKVKFRGLTLSRKLDVTFAVLFLIVYAIGCLVILIAPGAPAETQKILDSFKL